MTALLIGALTILVSYLIGAIPFGYLVARWRGVDILHQGSGNIGATNVGRVLGRRFGLLVFFLDFTKGALPVAAATLITAGWKEELRPWFGQEGLRVAAALAAFLGHLFPVYLRFRGGKGVATGAGVVTMLFPGPTLGALFTWVLVVSLTRYVSLASLCAGLILCALYLIFTPEPFAPDRYTLTLFCLLAVVLIWLRHRANIVRLLHGNENRMRDHPAFPVVTRMIHVLALGLWFGSTVFFTFVVAPVVFHTFAVLAETSSAERATLPLSNQFNPETSSLVAGAGLRPVFPWYFLLQGLCGFLAALTALSWSWH
ncbi:MAG: glycerol-3-phosphate 1-O-acyltransferase PlsY, partial [Planctomycetes bacterium]|nr:glycerol-3-phosphate 1-O-acyltransferase PlsY [Planctomycetota bacterium]